MNFFWILVVYILELAITNLCLKGPVVQMEMMKAVMIFLKKKLFVGSALLNLGRVVTPLRWNAAAKVSLHWLIENVP